MASHSSQRVLSHFVGIDVAATTATAVVRHHRNSPSPPYTFKQTSDGIAAFIHHLEQLGLVPTQTLIVVEATGSYWITLATRLHAVGYHLSVINPAHAHYFAKSRGQRAKTDPVDARMLSEFALERQPPSWSPPPPVYHELRHRLTARDGLRQMRLLAANQRHALEQWPLAVPSVLAHLTTQIATLDAQIEAVTAEIAAVLQASDWCEAARLLQSIPGIGIITTAWLLVTTVNFTLAGSADTLTAYAGLAPMPHESGTSVRGRATIGHSGNRQLRTALFLATLSAARYNPTIKVFYDRLRAAGKPAKVARCAAARKLLHLAWAVVTKGQPFDPAYAERTVPAGSMT